MAGPALEAIGVGKVFGGTVQALDGIHLAVARGETVALIGESGCGKTTLLRLFNRLLEPTRGEVRVGGRAASERDPVALRRSIGYVQQDGGLLPHWTVARNVELVPELLGWDRERRRERCNEMLDLVGLPADDYARRFPRELSGGQRQRVAFARAVAGDPETILLDEPFGALDALTRLELQDQFLGLKQRLDKTMLLVTHDLAEAFRLGDRIGVMREGRLLRLAVPDQLLEDPGDPYVARLVEQGLRLRGKEGG